MNTQSLSQAPLISTVLKSNSFQCTAFFDSMLLPSYTRLSLRFIHREMAQYVNKPLARLLIHIKKRLIEINWLLHTSGVISVTNAESQ